MEFEKIVGRLFDGSCSANFQAMSNDEQKDIVIKVGFIALTTTIGINIVGNQLNSRMMKLSNPAITIAVSVFAFGYFTYKKPWEKLGDNVASLGGQLMRTGQNLVDSVGTFLNSSTRPQ